VSRNKALRVSSFAAAPKDIARAYATATDTSPSAWKTVYTPVSEFLALEREAWAGGKRDDAAATTDATAAATTTTTTTAAHPPQPLPSAPLYTLRRIWAQGGTLYDAASTAGVDYGTNKGTGETGPQDAAKEVFPDATAGPDNRVLVSQLLERGIHLDGLEEVVKRLVQGC